MSKRAKFKAGQKVWLRAIVESVPKDKHGLYINFPAYGHIYVLTKELRREKGEG